MKGIKRKLLLVGLSLAIGGTAFLSLPRNAANAATLESEDYYKLVATAIDVSDTNAIESNKNPQIFDVSNSAFINAVSARKDSDTYASSIEAASAQEFSEKYTTLFSTTAGTSVGVLDNTVSTDVRGKFETNANTESWKQKIERSTGRCDSRIPAHYATCHGAFQSRYRAYREDLIIFLWGYVSGRGRYQKCRYPEQS